MMRRREFITLLGGTAGAWPLAARAQRPPVRMPRIGIIDDEPVWDSFRQGLRDFGYIENQNIAIEYRSAEGKVDRLAQAARELVSIPVDVIVVTGSPATHAVRQATSTIPIVAIGVGDPLRAGFAVSLARPGGNMTGLSSLSPDLIGKRLEILRECIPAVARVAFLWNPDNDSNLAFLDDLIVAVPALGLELTSAPIRNADEFEGTFAAVLQRRPNAALVTGDPLLRRHQNRIIDFVAKNRLPAMYQEKEWVAAGPPFVRAELARLVPARRLIRAQDSRGRQTSRPADRATNALRAGHQPQDRKSPRPDRTAQFARRRRRGD